MNHISQSSSIKIDNFSCVPLYVSMCFNNIEIAIGTAFVYLYENRSYLVTNWHNVTGREPVTLKCKSKQLAIPNRLHIRIPYHTKSETGATRIEWKLQVMPLYEDDGDAPIQPKWYEHPQHNHQIDLVTIPVDGIEKTGIIPANDQSLDLLPVQLYPSLDIFILGFPKGMSGGASFPVWKRGSIASEPDIDIDGLPKIFVDTTTREGMSGSPVYAQQQGLWLPEGSTDESDGIIGRGRRFVGIYSGRVGDDPFQAQLGIVWKVSAIEETIKGAKIGRSSFYM